MHALDLHTIDRECDSLVKHYELTDEDLSERDDRRAEAFSDLLDTFPYVDAPVLAERLAAAIYAQEA